MTVVVVMSDIHGNLPALEAVASALPDHDVAFVAGDLCEGGPCPAEVVDFLRETGWSVLMGNTDRDIAHGADELSKWAAAQLGPERTDWLAQLPFSRRFQPSTGERLLVVHANPLNMDEHLPPDMSVHELGHYLQGIEADILAFGHLHIPYVRPVEGVVLVDVSSVGHPKDGDSRAAYTVIRWEGEQRSIEQRRVPYDIEKTVRLLRESDIPNAEKHIASLLRASY